jgi:phage protein U
MFAQFGPIPLEILRVDGLEVRDSWAYAEHGVIDGKPRLQFQGRQLRQASLDFRLRVEHGDPEALLDRLRLAGDSGEAQLLQRGDGRQLGEFVVVELSDKPGWAYADGKPIAVTAKMKLQEYVGPRPAPRGQAVGAGDSPQARRADPAPRPARKPGAVGSGEIVRR